MVKNLCCLLLLSTFCAESVLLAGNKPKSAPATENEKVKKPKKKQKEEDKAVPAHTFLSKTTGTEIGAVAGIGAIAAIAAGFGFYAVYRCCSIAYGQYIFRNENTNTDGWFPVYAPQRTICRKWEHRYPAHALRQLYEELKQKDSYSLPTDLNTLVLNWNNGICRDADPKRGDGKYSYPHLAFVDLIIAEETELRNLVALMNSCVFFKTLHNWIGSFLRSDEFLDNIGEYQTRLKFLRQIILNSDECKLEVKAYGDRTLAQQQINAIAQGGNGIIAMNNR